MHLARVAKLAALVLAAGTLSLPVTVPAEAASASGTIVFVRGGNIWLVRADGTGSHQVTTDGTAADPYRSPSMSDAGIIAAGFGQKIVRMRQDGVVLNRMDPPPMLNSVSQPVDGPPVDVAISPDGTKIAFTMTSYTCPVGVECGARAVTGVTPASGFAGPSMTSYEWEPSWVSNSRLMVHGGYGSQVKLQDPTGGSQHWFDDYDVFGDFDSTDLGDASLSRDGTRLVAIRGYGDDTQMQWYGVTGDPRTDDPSTLPTPSPECIGAPGSTATDALLHDPAWSPDGTAFAIGAKEGIWVVAPGSTCEQSTFDLIGPGHEPSWSAAAINPPAAESFQMSERPRVRGAAQVGKRLVATTGTWSPSPTKVRFTWLRNGKAIKGATAKSYRVTRLDRGKKLAVRVQVSRPGLKTASATSRPTSVR